MISIYQCPVCRHKLEQSAKIFQCPNNHSFDLSREGYVNLLLPNQKKTKNPGDAKSMLQSREKFLSKGYYDPLSEKINEMNVEFQKTRDSQIFNILDVGCGTGMYSGKLASALGNENPNKQVQIWGIDISKSAIQMTAKKYPGIHFCVGSSFSMPYLNESIDSIFSVFSPFDAQELFRILKPGGKIMLVRPGFNHLQELGEVIYGNFELQGNFLDLAEDLPCSLIEKKHLQYQIHLKSNDDLMNLVHMTPYVWHLNEKTEAILRMKAEFAVTVNFQVSVYQK